ncbi:MAG: GIY-YIG nuclease family protein [Balneola sp.]
MITVYVISSISKKYRYVGMSSQVEIRLSRHNKGQNKTTKPFAPFKLIHTKSFKTRIEAREYEKYLKSGIGREFLNRIQKG